MQIDFIALATGIVLVEISGNIQSIELPKFLSEYRMYNTVVNEVVYKLYIELGQIIAQVLYHML